MTTGRERRLYVYALADPGLPPAIRVARRSLRVVTLEAASVIVQARRDPPQPHADAVREQHDLVTALADRFPALLPARFGSLTTEPQLRSVVEAHASEIVRALAAVRGRRQMTIRVFGPAQASPPEVVPTSGTEYLQLCRARARSVPPDAARIREHLGELAAAEHIERGQPGLRVVVYHLVAIDMIERYRERASELQSLLGPHRVTVSGPWPAFAFAPSLI